MAETNTPVDRIKSAFPGVVIAQAGPQGRPELTIDGARLRDLIAFIKKDPAAPFEMLIDLVAVDYSEYPGHTGPRFALVYNLKSISKGARLFLRVRIAEDACEVPSIHDLYKNANWLEREAFDQMGIVFTGHPNMKRILNHIEFVGHPLRKDYPITRRQWLSQSDDMLDEINQRLKAKGYV